MREAVKAPVPLPGSACVYCGNCIAECPTGALMAKPEFDLRATGEWDESKQHVTDTICPYCGVGSPEVCEVRLTSGVELQLAYNRGGVAALRKTPVVCSNPMLGSTAQRVGDRAVSLTYSRPT